jgi:hypothetical protein
MRMGPMLRWIAAVGSVRLRPFWLAACVVAMTAMLLPAAGVAAAFFVGIGGDDANPGTPAQPLKSIQRAVDLAAAGDTIRILDGTYSGAGNANVRWSDRSLTFMSDSGNRKECVIDCNGADGFRFLDTVLTDTHQVRFNDLSIVDADTAIAVLRTGFGNSTPVALEISRCALRDGYVGVASHGGNVQLVDSVLAGNELAGLHGGYAIGLAMSGCEVRGNGTGLFFTQMYGPGPVVLENTAFALNGTGIRYWQENANMELRQCRVDSSLTGHGLRAGSDFSVLTVDGCTLRGNAQHGIANTQGTYLVVNDTHIADNGYSGIAMPAGYAALDLESVTIVDNTSWGIGPFTWAALEAPMVPMGTSKSDKDPAHHIRINNCEVSGNGAGGVAIAGAYDPIRVTSSLVADNQGLGLQLGGTIAEAACEITSVTVVANRGNGIDVVAGQCTATNLLVTNNRGAAAKVLTGSDLALGCSNLFGNGGGDWVGAVQPQFGVDGNLSVDPLYCGLTTADYSLRADSPLAAANSDSCGTIGRFDAACPAPPDTVPPLPINLRDVPADQGGALTVSWPRHVRDSELAILPVQEYLVQRHWGLAWQTLGTLAATGADTYSVVVTTPDIMVMGQPAPLAPYRVVALTAAPGVSYTSAADSACSIDNLPPPAPVVELVESEGFRTLTWSLPPILDLRSVCVFRGTEPGFVAGEPIACPLNPYFVEHDLAGYYYRVQFTDTHGNAGAFSEELHGQYASDVPGAGPVVLRLLPNRPNPFNPQTTISYELPKPGRVVLSVFDLAGRCVRLLVDTELGAGRHEVTWDGRDATGQRLASGSYLARLVADGQMRSLLMGLVK